MSANANVLVLGFVCALNACASGSTPAGTDAASGDTGVGDVTTPPDTTTPPPPPPGPTVKLGEPHNGDYHLGPVEWEGSFNNSCSPYLTPTRTAYGAYLVGLDNSFNGNGQLCDACVQITTRMGKSVVLRVVTTGVSKNPNDADLSKAAYDLIHLEDPTGTSEHPRPMTWQIVKCAEAGKIAYQFQTGANEWWTSLWVRNVKIPIAKVEVKSKNHPAYFALTRGNDGTYTDGGGFGSGAFTIRVTGIDGQQVTNDFAKLEPGALINGTSQFD